ncbi:MAG TPA: tyrosine-type recombinase/integrase [Urbifossiella sp.]|nr:tyrosine-type recombinase/integrase [Urbifossiella sp.]
MPKPFKPTRPFRLPAGAEVVTDDGKPHVRLRERGKSVLYPLTKSGTKYLRPAKRWYFDLRDADGTVRRVKGFADLKATEQLAAEMERKASRVRAGIIDPAEEHALRPLADHLHDYAAYLESKGNTPKHVALSTGRVVAMLAGAGAVFLKDVDAGRTVEWLNNLRRDGAPVTLPEGVEAFRPSEAAALLGVSPSALANAVRRHQLAAVGNGKARRLPLATVQALLARAARGSGPGTVNHYVRAARGFFRWLVRSKRIGSNPLESLALVNAAVDVRRARRELTADELRRLFLAAMASARAFRGLTGTDRYFLYLTAAGTGFRANALANLTPGDFDLTPAGPVVTLPARFNKSRKTKVQPMPADVAAALRDYLVGKPVGTPVWGGTWARDERGAEMLRIDLDAAGIPYAVDGPDGPEYADFHALRHSYLTRGGRAGIDLRTLQELAGHSDPVLTARDSHRRLYDLAGAVEKLPPLVPTTNAEGMPLRLTGTHGAESGQFRPLGAVPDAVTGCAGLRQTASIGNNAPVGASRNPLEMQGAGADLRRPASVCMSEPGGDRTLDQRIKSPFQAVRCRPQTWKRHWKAAIPIRICPPAFAPLATQWLHREGNPRERYPARAG